MKRAVILEDLEVREAIVDHLHAKGLIAEKTNSVFDLLFDVSQVGPRDYRVRATVVLKDEK